MGKSFYKSSKNMLRSKTQRQFSNGDEEICISIKRTKNEYHQDCFEQKLIGDKGECFTFPTKQKDSFFHARLPSLHSFNGFQRLTFRIKAIFKFYIDDDYLHLMMPMSFFVGMQEAFMARDFVNVSIPT